MQAALDVMQTHMPGYQAAKDEIAAYIHTLEAEAAATQALRERVAVLENLLRAYLVTVDEGTPREVILGRTKLRAAIAGKDGGR